MRIHVGNTDGWRPGRALLILAGAVVAVCAGAAGAAAQPPWKCPPALQSHAANCVAAFVLGKDMSLEVCPCDQHGADFSNMQIPPNWTSTVLDLEITKWKAPTDPDPCITYTINGNPQKICW